MKIIDVKCPTCGSRGLCYKQYEQWKMFPFGIWHKARIDAWYDQDMKW